MYGAFRGSLAFSSPVMGYSRIILKISFQKTFNLKNRPASQIFMHSIVCNKSTLLLFSLPRKLSVFIGTSLNTLAPCVMYSELEDKLHHWPLMAGCHWLGNKDQESPAIPLIGVEHPFHVLVQYSYRYILYIHYWKERYFKINIIS